MFGATSCAEITHCILKEHENFVCVCLCVCLFDFDLTLGDAEHQCVI